MKNGRQCRICGGKWNVRDASQCPFCRCDEFRKEIETLKADQATRAEAVAALIRDCETAEKERDEWKNTCVKAGCADLNGRNIVKDLEAERDRFREQLTMETCTHIFECDCKSCEAINRQEG